MRRRIVFLLILVLVLGGCTRPPARANQIALTGTLTHVIYDQPLDATCTLQVQPMQDATGDRAAGPMHTVALVVTASHVTVPLDAATLFGTQIAPWLMLALQCPSITGDFWATLTPRLEISRVGVLPNGGNGSLCRIPGDPDHTARPVLFGDVYTFQLALTADAGKDD